MRGDSIGRKAELRTLEFEELAVVMRPIQSFSSNVLAELIRRQPASKEKTRFAWQMAVGPALARVTSVELAQGALTVRCADPRWVPEVSRAREVILARLQETLGPEIRRLVICDETD